MNKRFWSSFSKRGVLHPLKFLIFKYSSKIRWYFSSFSDFDNGKSATVDHNFTKYIGYFFGYGAFRIPRIFFIEDVPTILLEPKFLSSLQTTIITCRSQNIARHVFQLTIFLPKKEFNHCMMFDFLYFKQTWSLYNMKDCHKKIKDTNFIPNFNNHHLSTAAIKLYQN